jgi:hypothetical protein
LQQDVERLQESNSLKASTTESLKHSMAQLSYEWYAAKESAVKMQDNLLAVYENLAINMARKRRGDWLRRVFREWCYTAREIKVDALQEHFDMLQQQQANLCQLLADARQRAEVLEVCHHPDVWSSSWEHTGSSCLRTAYISGTALHMGFKSVCGCVTYESDDLTIGSAHRTLCSFELYA